MTRNILSSTRLGFSGPQSVSAVGLGAMGMSGMYGASDEAQSIATIHAALDAGVNLIDTGHIDIYRIARLDPNVPIEDTIGAIADMVKAGFVRHIGLSEVGIDTIQKAHAVHPITDLQIEYSLLSRGQEGEIFPVLKRLGIGVTAYGVLSRGLLSGSKPTGPGDFRTHLPRFTGDNAVKNQQLVDVLQQLAAGLGASASQVAIAWVLARGKALGLDMVALAGSRTLKQLDESVGALKLRLSGDDQQRIEAALPADAVAGTRYAAEHMANLDSEK
jgi:aryl-alcohol dehydrogenase-like predicted oxidoreductase